MKPFVHVYSFYLLPFVLRKSLISMIIPDNSAYSWNTRQKEKALPSRTWERDGSRLSARCSIWSQE
jgi:hypothetical protein